jgi:hypothetical protein
LNRFHSCHFEVAVFDWLFEGRTGIYVVLAGVVVLLLILWWQSRKRWLLLGMGVAAALVGLYALLDYVVETDREQIVRKVKEMTAAVNAGNLDAAFVHVSDQFRSPKGRTKQDLRQEGQTYLNDKIVERVEMWDVVCIERPSRENKTTKVFFKVKVDGPQIFLADCDATFDFHPEHGWRLKSVRLLKPGTNEEWQWQI